MGSADEGTTIRVKLDEVALKKLRSGDPCLMPCVDCGLVTTDFCDTCWGEDPFPQDKAHGKFIPLCRRCELVNGQCHFCRREHWCDPPAWWDYHSVRKHALMLPGQGDRPIATGALKINATDQDYEKKKTFKIRDKQTFKHMEPYLTASDLSMLQSRPSSSSTEAPKVIEALCECECCKLKSKQKYRCKPSASKAPTLSKMFRHWPLTAFENLSDEEKVAFWRQGSKTRENMLKDLEVSITTEHLNKEISGKNK